MCERPNNDLTRRLKLSTVQRSLLSVRAECKRSILDVTSYVIWYWVIWILFIQVDILCSIRWNDCKFLPSASYHHGGPLLFSDLLHGSSFRKMVSPTISIILVYRMRVLVWLKSLSVSFGRYVIVDRSSLIAKCCLRRSPVAVRSISHACVFTLVCLSLIV